MHTQHLKESDIGSFNYKLTKKRHGIGIVCTNLGNIHFKNGRLDEAIKFFRRALKVTELEYKNIF